jgi:hypothetical protein
MNNKQPGSISWAVFLKMGALNENSPNSPSHTYITL